MTVAVRMGMPMVMPGLGARPGRIRGLLSHVSSLVVARIYCQPKRLE
jgi:hypothetical protein